MKISLNLTNEKREIFMEYFHASYRKLAETPFSPSGQARHRSDGCYEIFLTFPLQINSGVANLTWIIVIEKDGSLNQLEVQSEVPEDSWSEAATKYVNEVLGAAFSGNLTKYFYRHYFCRMGAELHGEYWLPGFRFAPSMPEDENSYLMNAERYFYIDQEVNSIDQVHGGDIATERAIRYSARLSLILDVALYQPSGGKRWFMMTDESGNLVSRREQLGFVAPSRPTQMPRKGTECRLGEFGGSVLDENQNSSVSLLRCPVEARKILRGLNECVPNIKEAFDSCARLYQTSLVAGRGFPTIRLAYKVGAIESIIQKVDGFASFSEFVRKEADLSDGDNEFLDYLYGSVRSAHFHGGEFPLGEYRPRKWSLGLSDPSDTSRFNFNMVASKVLRKSIMNWVIREVASKSDELIRPASLL